MDYEPLAGLSLAFAVNPSVRVTESTVDLLTTGGLYHLRMVILVKGGLFPNLVTC